MRSSRPASRAGAGAAGGRRGGLVGGRRGHGASVRPPRRSATCGRLQVPAAGSRGRASSGCRRGPCLRSGRTATALPGGFHFVAAHHPRGSSAADDGRRGAGRTSVSAAVRGVAGLFRARCHGVQGSFPTVLCGRHGFRSLRAARIQAARSSRSLSSSSRFLCSSPAKVASACRTPRLRWKARWTSDGLTSSSRAINAVSRVQRRRRACRC